MSSVQKVKNPERWKIVKHKDGTASIYHKLHDKWSKWFSVSTTWHERIQNGQGLFALRDFEPGDILGFYSGTPVSSKATGSTMLLQNSSGKIIDGSTGNTGWIQFANDASGSSILENNMEVDNRMIARCIQHIAQGDEILWDYGDSYWTPRKKRIGLY